MMFCGYNCIMKNVLKAAVLLFVFAITYSCNSNSAKTDAPKKIELILHPTTAADSDKNDSVAIAQVTALPEFNNILKWFQKNNKDTATRHIGVIIGQEPVKEFKYYWVKVGVDGPDKFEDLEHFYVNDQDETVHYLDIKTDSLMSLDQWRNSGKDTWKNSQ